MKELSKKIEVKKSISSHDRSENNLFTHKNISSPFQQRQAEFFNHTYSERASDHHIQAGTREYSHLESIGSISKHSANEMTISNMEKISQQEIQESRSIEDVQQEPKGEEQLLKEHLGTLAKFQVRDQAVDELVSKTVESLRVEEITSGETKLENHLAELRKAKEPISSELKKLYDKQKKRVFSSLQLEINILDNSDKNVKIAQEARTQDIYLQAVYTSSIQRAESQIQKINAAIEKTQIALIHREQAEGGPPTSSASIKALIDATIEKIPTTLIRQELAKGEQTLKESIATMKGTATKFRERARAVAKLVGKAESLEVEGTNWASEHIDTLYGKIRTINEYMKELQKNKGNIGNELNDTHDINNRAKAYFDWLRLRINQLRNPDTKEQIGQDVSHQEQSWQEFNGILVEHAGSQIKKIDEAIEKTQHVLDKIKEQYKFQVEKVEGILIKETEDLSSISDENKIIEVNSALNKATTETKKSRSIKDMQQVLEEEQVWLNEYRTSVNASFEKWDQYVNEVISQRTEGTGQASIENPIATLEAMKKYINSKIEGLSKQKDDGIKHYSRLQSEIGKLDDPTGNAKIMLKNVTRKDNAYKVICDSIIRKLQLQIEKIDVAIEERQGALNKTMKEVKEPRIADIQQGLAEEQVRLNEYRKIAQAGVKEWDRAVDELVSQKIEGTNPDSIKEHIMILQNRKENLNSKKEEASNIKSKIMKRYEELRLEIKELGGTTENVEIMLNTAARQNSAYQVIYNTIIRSAKLQIEKIDVAIKERQRTLKEIQEPRIADIQRGLAEGEVRLNKYRTFARAKVKEWDQYVNKLLSQKIDETNLDSIEDHITILRNTKENLNRQIEAASNDKSGTMKYYNELRSKINKLGDPTGNAEIIRNVVAKNSAYQKIYDDIIGNAELQIRKIDEAQDRKIDEVIEKAQRKNTEIDEVIEKAQIKNIKNMPSELDDIIRNITQEIQVPHDIAGIRDELAKHQGHLADYIDSVQDRNRVFNYWRKLIDQAVSWELEGRSLDSIEKYLINLQTMEGYLNGKIETLSNAKSARMEAYQSLQSEVQELSNTPDANLHSSIAEGQNLLLERKTHSLYTDSNERQKIRIQASMQNDIYQSIYDNIIKRARPYIEEIGEAMERAQYALDNPTML